VGTALDTDSIGTLLERVLSEAGVSPVVSGLPDGVEAVRRIGASGSYLFLMNHTTDELDVPVTGTDLLTGGPAGRLGVEGVAVVREQNS
jgi:beta-galactosidase